MAKLLGIFDNAKIPKPINFLDSDFTDATKSSSCEIIITDNVLKLGHRIMDIPFPDKTLVVMLKRGEHYFIPNGKTELFDGDKLLIITDDKEAVLETYRQIGLQKEIPPLD
jgi:cell volume regulation protein A